MPCENRARLPPGSLPSVGCSHFHSASGATRVARTAGKAAMSGACACLPQLKCFVAHLECLFLAAGAAVGPRQVEHRIECVRVLRASHLAPERHQLLPQFERLVAPVGFTVGVGQFPHDGERVGMLRAAHLAPERHQLLPKFERVVLPAGLIVGIGEWPTSHRAWRGTPGRTPCGVTVSTSSLQLERLIRAAGEAVVNAAWRIIVSSVSRMLRTEHLAADALPISLLSLIASSSREASR